MIDGVTPGLWQSVEEGDATDGWVGNGVTVVRRRRGRPGSRRALGLQGRRVGRQQLDGCIGPHPRTADRVAALPPVRDVPDIDIEAEKAPRFILPAGDKFVAPYRKYLAAGLVLVILDAAATLAGPLLIRSGLDNGVAKGSQDGIWVAAALFFVVTSLDLVDSVWQVMVTGKTAERLLLALRVRIWSQLQRLSMDFYEREMGGRIMTRMTTTKRRCARPISCSRD